MKTTVYITKKLAFAVLFLMIGVYCTLYGIITVYREYRCIPLEDLSMKNYRKGAYVAGTIDSCVTNVVDGKAMGESVGYITMVGIFHCYTIPMTDSHYIRIMLPDEHKVHALDDLIAGNGEGVYVEGQILKEMVEPNYLFYEHCEQIKNPQEEVVDGYEIRQISFSNRRNVLYFGIGMTAVMIFVIWKGKLIAEAYDVEEEAEKLPIKKVENSEFEPWRPYYLSGTEHEAPEMEKSRTEHETSEAEKE